MSSAVPSSSIWVFAVALLASDTRPSMLRTHERREHAEDDDHHEQLDQREAGQVGATAMGVGVLDLGHASSRNDAASGSDAAPDGVV